MARESGTGFVLETPTWRASADWGARLGYDETALAGVNRKSVGFLLELRDQYESARTPVVVCGAVGPRGDGYSAAARMSAGAARDYHARQVGTLAATGADMIAAWTLNYADEAIGIAQASRAAGIPVAISFTVETDGRLPSSETLADAIARTDDAAGGYPAYYMINCAHPTHFRHVLEAGGGWRARVKGIRANASKRSHQELDGSADLDMGDPGELGRDYRELGALLPQLSIVGGCCGTDHRHVAAIARALAG
ncbi:MAG: homocysteine S-methyltransferase family protein [Burkholderiales bacterium]|nr:homocysteine S-methyltransferase family protein [Burkholderiales bacterium]